MIHIYNNAMRYITFLQKDLTDINRNEIDESIIKLLNPQIAQHLFFEEYKHYGFILYVENNVDISLISENYRKYFEIKELNIEEVILIIDSLDANLKTIINEDGTISRLNLIDYENVKHKYIYNKKWDDKLKIWKYSPKILPESLFSSELVDNKIIYDKRLHEKRFLRTFHLWCVDEINDSEFSDACTNNSYILSSLETVTHSTKKLQDLVIDSELKYKKILNHTKVIDIEPLACVTYQEFMPQDVYTFLQIIRIHPQCAARTIQELFRLIIEWAYVYNEFENTEPAAKLCHDILRAVQMPIDVRAELLNQVPPQVVERYIRGDVNVFIEDEYDPPMPVKFKKWISDVYLDFYPVNSNLYENIDINNLPESYPV